MPTPPPEPVADKIKLHDGAPLGSRDPALDGLRGIAILLVFVYHYGGGLRAHSPLIRSLGYLTQASWVGVDLFFALSGFLITGILIDSLASPGWLRIFFTRRSLRILPLYGFALLLCALAALLSGAPSGGLKPLLIYAVFLQNFPPLLNLALHTPPPLPLYHLWSLAVEEQFYLVWPFLLLAARTPRRIFHLSLAIFALSCAFRAFLFLSPVVPAQTAQSFAIFLPLRAGALALGAALAASRRCSPAYRSTRPAILGLTAGLGLFLGTAIATHTFLLINPAAFAIGLPGVDLLSAATVALSLRGTSFRALLSVYPLRFLGRISYGFYVFHVLLEPLVDRLGLILTQSNSGFGYQAARLLCAFPLATAAAWLSFRFLEAPFLRLGTRFPEAPAIPLQLAAQDTPRLRPKAASKPG